MTTAEVENNNLLDELPREAASLTLPQQRALHAMLQGHCLQVAAQAAGVSQRALRDWRQRPGFLTALLRGRADLWCRSLATFEHGADVALGGMVTLFQSHRPAVRLRAARAYVTEAFAALREDLDGREALLDLHHGETGVGDPREELPELTDRQLHALSALVACHTRAQAAHRAGISLRTLYYWLGEPNFRQGLALVLRETRLSRATLLLANLDLALAVLDQLANGAATTEMEAFEVTHSVRMGAARALLQAQCESRKLAEREMTIRDAEDRFDNSMKTSENAGEHFDAPGHPVPSDYADPGEPLPEGPDDSDSLWPFDPFALALAFAGPREDPQTASVPAGPAVPGDPSLRAAPPPPEFDEKDAKSGSTRPAYADQADPPQSLPARLAANIEMDPELGSLIAQFSPLARRPPSVHQPARG
jgi:hypothetical protein